MATPDRELSLRTRLLVLAVVVVAIVGGFVVAQRVPGRTPAAAATGAPAETSIPRVGEKARDFTAADAHGKAFTLAQLQGRPVWLTFGASWCAGCRAEAPDIQATYAAAKDAGLEVVAVYLSEDERAVTSYADRLGLAYTHVPDPRGTVSNLYGARAVPMHVFVGVDGVVRRVDAGILTPDAIRQAVASLRA